MKKLMVFALAVQVAGLAGCATPRRTTSYSRPVYSQPNYSQQPTYSQPVYTKPQSTSQDEFNKKIIKQGILGAATGAIAAEASGGKAGKGALIGAGTNIIGGALLDMLTAPRQSQPQQYQQYAPYVDQYNQQNPGTNRIVRKYDADGNVVSEEVYTR